MMPIINAVLEPPPPDELSVVVAGGVPGFAGGVVPGGTMGGGAVGATYLSMIAYV
jgi:hypothetical protein